MSKKSDMVRDAIARDIKKQSDKLVQDYVNLLQRWKNIDQTNYPISGSNIFQTKEYIKAFNNFQDNNETTQNANTFQLNFLWTELRFFENLLTFENDTFLELYGHRLSQIAYFNGCVGLFRPPLSKELISFALSINYTDSLGNPLTGYTYLAPFIAPEVIVNQKYDKQLKRYDQCEFDITKKPWKNNLAVWKWNSLGLTSLWEITPFIYILKKIFGYFQENIPLSVLNWIFYVRNSNSEITQAELKAFRDKTVGVKTIDQRLIYTDDKGKPIAGNQANAYNIEELSRHPNEFTSADFNIVKNIMNYCSSHFANVNEKRERNTVSETSVNTVHFGISWMEYLREAKLFVYQYNKLFKRNATVSLTYDLFQQNEEIIGNQESVNKNDEFNSF